MYKQKSRKNSNPDLTNVREKLKVKKSLWHAHDGKCVYCGRQLSLEGTELEIEHVVPEHYDKKKERKLVFDHWRLPENFDLASFSNLVPACRNCNSRKGFDGFSHMIATGLEAAREKLATVLLHKRWYDDEEEFMSFSSRSSLSPADYYHLSSGKPTEFEKQTGVSTDFSVLAESKVHLSYALPTYPDLTGAASFNFKNLMISECSFSFSHNQLLENLFFNHNSTVSPRARKFILSGGVSGESDLIGFGNDSFFLPRNQTEQLCQLIDELAPKYIERIRKYTFEIFRAQNFERSKTDGFRLVKIKRSLWRMMINFAYEHDFDRGDTSRHIFDACPGMLKVYCRSENDARRNHRVFIRAERVEDGWTDFYQEDDEVWLCWSSMTATATRMEEEAFPLGVLWDVERTHDWIIGDLIPQVIRWRDLKFNRKSKSFLGFLFNRNEPRTDFSNYYQSLRQVNEIECSSIDSFAQLQNIVRELQSFYAVFRRLFIPPAIMREVYSHLKWCLQNFYLNQYSVDYINGNLHNTFSGESQIKIIDGKLEDTFQTSECYASEMEMALRTLIELYEEGLPEPETYKILSRAKKDLAALIRHCNDQIFLNGLVKNLK